MASRIDIIGQNGNDGEHYDAKPHRIIIAGGRDFYDFRRMEKWFLHFFEDIDSRDIEIVSGGARGADSLATDLAAAYFLSLHVFPADWEAHGKAAGHIRNRQMAEYATDLLAFWDGESRGTKNMIETAKKLGLGIHVVRYD